MDKRLDGYDLDAEARAYWHKNIKLEPHIILSEGKMVEIARHFAEWQREKMIKEAIETDVRIDVPIDDDYVYVRAYVKKELLQPRERVKVIILKED